MNTRGLTELIVLNIGLSLGVISPLLFTMLVIMALVTTFMTSPLLEWTFPSKADLTIAGTSRTWGIERQTLGVYTDQLARECHSSLLITRRYSPIMSHLTSLFDAKTI